MARKRELPNGEVRGRDTRLNVNTATAIINTLQGGAYVTTACSFTGVSRTSYHEWVRRGEDEIARVNTLGHDAESIVTKAAITIDTDGRIINTKVADMFKNRPAPFHASEWPFVVFAVQQEKARSGAELRALTSIQKAGETQWQAHAWFLERTLPERYGRRDRINLEGSKDGSPVAIEVSTVDDLEAKIAALRQGSGE